MAGMTPEEARQYLANVVASGLTEWQPTKNLDEYKDATVERKAREFQKMEHAGLPLDNRVARGHGKSEGGRAPKLPAPAEAYDLMRKGEQAGIDVTFEHDQARDRYLMEVEPETPQEAAEALDFLRSTAPNTHVVIKYQGIDGKWHTIYSKGGRRIDSIYAAYDASDYESFDEWLEDESGDVYEGSSERYGGGGYSFVSIR